VGAVEEGAVAAFEKGRWTFGASKLYTCAIVRIVFLTRKSKN
jgi:hypothetical protein